MEEKSILLAESGILATLEWSISITTSLVFMEEYVYLYYKDVNQGIMNKDYLEEENLSKFVLGISLLSYDLVKYPNSLKAASAIHIAREMKNVPLWPKEMEEITRYKESELEKCRTEMVIAIANSVALYHDSPDQITQYMLLTSKEVMRVYQGMVSRLSDPRIVSYS
jgi:hypothetical protein